MSFTKNAKHVSPLFFFSVLHNYTFFYFPTFITLYDNDFIDDANGFFTSLHNCLFSSFRIQFVFRRRLRFIFGLFLIIVVIIFVFCFLSLSQNR